VDKDYLMEFSQSLTIVKIFVGSIH